MELDDPERDRRRIDVAGGAPPVETYSGSAPGRSVSVGTA